MTKKKYILVTVWPGTNKKKEDVAKAHGPFKSRREAEAFHFSHRSLWKAKENKILEMDSPKNNEDRVKVSS